MIIDPFYLRLLLAFAFGSFWITLTTILAERAGSSVGGFIGGLPSVSFLSLLFIGYNQSAEVASQDSTILPAILSFSCFFLLSFAFFTKRRSFALSLLLSFMIWFGLASLLVLFNFQDFTLSIIVFFLLSSLTYYAFERKLLLPPVAAARIRYTPPRLIGRALFAGTAIALSVFASQFGGPIFGGILAGFPATFTATLVIVYSSEGLAFSRVMAKPLAQTAIVTSFPYSVSVKFLYPILGIVSGTIVCYSIVIPFALASYWWVSKNKSARGEEIVPSSPDMQ